jgi:YHS domain-containing protein
MRTTVVLLALIAASGCNLQRAPQQQPANPIEIRTVDNTPIQPMPVEKPPMVTQQESAPVLRKADQQNEAARKAHEASLQKRVELPFAPAIAMDPVDGGKVSIRSDTPIHEFEGKLYYFTSEANKRAFIASPETYLKTGLARY